MEQQPIPLPHQHQAQPQSQLQQQSQSIENVTPAVHALQSIQESQAGTMNDDSDSDEEDRAMKKREPKMIKKELNRELLEKLIDQPNLVQEIQQGKNSKLLSYISQDDVLSVLIDYLTDSVSSFEKLYFDEQANLVPHDEPDVKEQTTDEEGEMEMEMDLEEEEEEEEEGEEVESKTDEELEDELPYGKETAEEKYRRRATTAGEILSVQNPPIISQRLLLPITDKDAIKSNEVAHFELLGKLWNGILSIDFHVENVINLTLFVKIIENLMRLNANEFMNFIRQNQQKYPLVDQILKHASVSQFMELLIKLISLDKVDNPIGLIEILHDQQLITRMLVLLEDCSLFLQSSIGDFLTNLISISANTPALYDADPENLANQIESPIIGPNDLTRSLVTDENVERIIKIIMKGGPCLPTCVSLIIEIIRKNNSDYDSIDLLDDDFTTNPPNSRDPIFVGGMLKIFGKKLIKIFNRFFQDGYHVTIVNTTIGEQEPVGFERFKTIELIAELLHCSNMILLNQVGSEDAIAKRDEFKNQKLELMNDALADNIVGDLEPEDCDIDNHSKHFAASLQERSNSSDTHLSGILGGTGGLGGGDGSRSLVDLEKLTNDIKSFSIGPENDNLAEIETKDEEKPDDMSIGDFFKTQLIKGGMLIHIFSMLKKFPWNNFLHNVIFDIAQQILNGKYDTTNLNRDLIFELFSRDKCNLTNYVVDCYKYSEEKEDHEHLRLGYMGHLILISEELVKFSSKVYAAVEDHGILFDENKEDEAASQAIIQINNDIHEIISEDEWLEFVNNELVTIRDMYNQVLGGFSPDETDTYLNPNTILLGNGEGDESNEEAVEDYDSEPFDDNDDSRLSYHMDSNGVSGQMNFEVIEGREETDSDSSGDEEEEGFGEALCPVPRHKDGDEIEPT